MNLFGKCSDETCREQVAKLTERVADLERALKPMSAEVSLMWEKVDVGLKRLARRQRDFEKHSPDSVSDEEPDVKPLSRAERRAQLRRRVTG